MKVIKSFVGAKKREGPGFLIRRALGSREMYHHDPLLMLDHLLPIRYAPGQALGAPSHPHRGFTTVTIVIKGGMNHRDSEGNQSNLRPGWVQWMDAASGVIHSEMPSDEMLVNNLEKGGDAESFQLWVNLPAKNKTDPPMYQDVPPEEIPVVESNECSIRVIAGEYNGVPGAIVTKTPIHLLDVRFKPTGMIPERSPFVNIADSFSRNMNVMGYVYRGQVGFHDTPTKSYADGTTLIFGHDLNLLPGSSKSDVTSPICSLQAKCMVEDSANVDDDGYTTRMLLIGGVPIGEPIVKRGMYVMNTKEEIHRAEEDYKKGTLARKQMEGVAEELEKTRKARMLQMQSGTWKKINDSI